MRYYSSLCVKGMMRNHKLARQLANVNFGEIRRQLEYKGEKYGCDVYIVDRFFASSKTCSKCGHKKEHLSLSERTFHCEKCGLTMDRDENAALCLEQVLYLPYEDFSQIVKDCSKKMYNKLRRKILSQEKNDEFHRDSLWRPEGFRSNRSVRVNESEIEQ